MFYFDFADADRRTGLATSISFCEGRFRSRHNIDSVKKMCQEREKHRNDLWLCMVSVTNQWKLACFDTEVHDYRKCTGMNVKCSSWFTKQNNPNRFKMKPNQSKYFYKRLHRSSRHSFVRSNLDILLINALQGCQYYILQSGAILYNNQGDLHWTYKEEAPIIREIVNLLHLN